MKVESYKIKGWKKKERGLLISENENWILVKHIPIDYAIDGYKIYAKKYIKRRKSSAKEKQIERVLSLKKISLLIPDDFKFGTTINLLKWVESKFGLFEFQDESEDDLFYGKINDLQENALMIDMVNSDGTIENNYDYEFDIDKIRSITFRTDYFESICLLMEDEINQKNTIEI